MKKALFILALLTTNTAHAYSVCGAPVDGTGYSYTQIITQGELDIANWAVGSGCNDATTNIDIPTMCTNVIAGGQAFCSSTYQWQENADLDETTASYGTYCWCRRTTMDVGGTLMDSVGQWVLLGDLPNKCQIECAKYCAINVAENAGGMRHAIMVLPQY